jgi:hypothetical protein
MTANRNLKQRARARQTGESYAAARHQLTDGPGSMTVAAAQLPLFSDPGEAGQVRAAGAAVRALMRQASARGGGGHRARPAAGQRVSAPARGSAAAR